MSQGISSTGLRSETEFLRRYNNRLLDKQKKIRTIRVKGLHIFLVFLLVSIAALAAWRIAVFVLTWDKLNVKYYTLIGPPKFHTSEIQAVLRKFNGNILTINFTQLRQSILHFKEVKEVYLGRKLPSTIEVRFILRKPVFQVAFNGKYNFLDIEGIILHTSSEPNYNLITIKDVPDNDLGELIPFLPELNRIRNSIEYVGLQKPYGILLKLKGLDEIFFPGDGNFAKKINHYIKIRQTPQLKNFLVKRVDLRFDDRIYFEFQEKNDKETETGVHD